MEVEVKDKMDTWVRGAVSCKISEISPEISGVFLWKSYFDGLVVWT